MDKNTNFIGVDISKDRFDTWDPVNKHRRFGNDTKGFEQFLLSIPASSWVVMEATACYYQKLVVYLYENGVAVSVVNPVVIKRYIQMKLRHNKTDKADAKMIREYASEQPLNRWVPQPAYIESCKLIYSSVMLYNKNKTMLKNKLHSLVSRGYTTGTLVRSLKRQIKSLEKEIHTLETELEQLVKEQESTTLTNLSSIHGIGKKTALLLIITTNGFRNFNNAGQLSAYFGLAPMERTSGSSIRGVSRISKKGNPDVRNHLFLCSFTACHKNPQCNKLYERIVARGKSKKLALIAVSNKLLKLAFAVAKSGIPYDPNYKGSFAQV
ncbi:MAG TPA: IS110 family transposase [Bacteroidales bacterium]|nr:IS110 family transposase [Bacteroidales bacterium]